MTIPSVTYRNAHPSYRTPRKAPQTQRFGFVGQKAIQQLITDTSGIWLPKMLFVRSKTQFFEDTFLEWVENAAFYFTAPLSGRFVFAPLFHRLAGLDKSTPIEHLGLSLKAIKGPISRRLIAAKAGTVVSAVALACGFEYMIQHAKNVISANKFKTKNFSAVAGLEAARFTAEAGEEDPVVKAKRRLLQVFAGTATIIGCALLLPSLALRFQKPFSFARTLLKVIDYPTTTPFDLSKPILATIMASGVVSYMDAARDSLERKEIGTRLLFIVPYLLFGKELAGNAIAKYLENTVIGKGAKAFRIKDKVRFIDEKLFQQESALDFSKVKSSVENEVKALNLSQALKDTLLNRFKYINRGSYVLSAGAMGAGLSWLMNYQTRQRFLNQKASEKRERFPVQQQPRQFQQSPIVRQPFSEAPSPFALPQQGSPWAYPQHRYYYQQ